MPASKLDINLLSQTGLSGKPLGKFLRWSLTYGRYIIITTQIIVLLAFFSRFKFDQDLSDLHSKIEEKTNIIKALAPVEENTRSLQRKLEIIKILESSRTLYIKVLTNLSTQTPSDVSIDNINFTENKLNISGFAINNAALAEFLNFIRKNNYFSQVTLDQVSKQAGMDIIDFSLSMDIEDVLDSSTQSASLK